DAAPSGPRRAGLKAPRYINMDKALAARNRSQDERFAPNRRGLAQCPDACGPALSGPRRGAESPALHQSGKRAMACLLRCTPGRSVVAAGRPQSTARVISTAFALMVR